MRWYLEEFLEYPFPLQTERADAVQTAVSVNNFMIFYRQTPPDNQAALREIWEEAGLEAFPESGNQAAPAKRSWKEKMFGWLGRRGS